MTFGEKTSMVASATANQEISNNNCAWFLLNLEVFLISEVLIEFLILIIKALFALF